MADPVNEAETPSEFRGRADGHGERRATTTHAGLSARGEEALRHAAAGLASVHGQEREIQVTSN